MNDFIDKQILDALYQHSSPEISDALDACGINGYLSGIKPIGNSKKLVGPAYTVQYQALSETPKQFMQASNYIDDVPSGYVVIIDNGANTSCSVWGAILTHFAHNKKIIGTVVNGAIRDVIFHEKYQYPLYATGVTPRTGKNRARIVSSREALTINSVSIRFNDILFADRNGVLVIPKEHVGKILKMVQNISVTEQKIIAAIDAGKPLKLARELYHYDKPWEENP